jgi:hypothetical protein
MAEIMLTRNGSMKWIAKVDGEEFIGNNPEDAIGKIIAIKPEMVNSDIKYQLFAPKANCCCGKKSNTDLGKCPVCNKPVVFAKVKKSNGRMGVAVFHEGELPEGAEINPTATDEYKRWLLKEFHKTVVIQETPKLVVKEKITKLAEVVKEAKVPPINISIDGMKHNRFAIIGQVARGLKESGLPDNKVSEIRKILMTDGKSFNDLVSVSAEYVTLTEGGMPVHLESGM